jgi:hypothetical protein
VRDVEPVEFPRQDLPRIEPRHGAAWFRVGGRWRRGWLVKWVRLPSGVWVAWARWRGDRPASDYGWLLYDPEVIRPRDGDEPPTG